MDELNKELAELSPAPFNGPGYIAVEGVIGAGKTSFAKLLADRIGASLELDEGFENPFLVDFYRNRERYAFPAQLFFLLNRFQKQQALQTHDLFAGKIVSDYIFARDALFASVTLAERELKLYEKIAPILERDIPRPDLVIYLQASTDALMHRIKLRGDKTERHVDREYIDRLKHHYWWSKQTTLTSSTSQRTWRTSSNSYKSQSTANATIPRRPARNLITTRNS
jgi:deoxyadenosine/deoxycytidine kinase